MRLVSSECAYISVGLGGNRTLQIRMIGKTSLFMNPLSLLLDPRSMRQLKVTTQ